MTAIQPRIVARLNVTSLTSFGWSSDMLTVDRPA